MAYTTIDDGSEYFTTTLWTGSGTSSGRSITNSANAGNFKPDWLWIKPRTGTNATHHQLYDSSRGVSKSLRSSATAAEIASSAYGHVSAFDTNGFTSVAGSNNNENINENSSTFVAWQWKANGGTTTSFTESGSNPGGNYQANTTAGFSIVTYTGTGSNGTVQHGLSSAPELVIVKQRDDDEHDWQTGSDFLTSWAYRLKLNDNVSEASVATSFNSTAPTSSVFTVGSNSDVNEDAHGYVGYCFHSVQGYSKIGKYTGNGSTDGPFVYTGFKPAWWLGKKVDAAENWFLIDNARHPINDGNIPRVIPNNTDAESEDSSIAGDFLSNGFKIRATQNMINNSGSTYFFMAFAEHPFVSSKGVPVTAR